MVEFLCCGLDSKGNTLISKEIQRLEKENQRLKEQLDQEIKNNRKLVLGLKMVAYMTPKAEEIALQQAIKISQTVLKETGEEK